MDLNTIAEVVEHPLRPGGAAWRRGDAWLGGGTWLFSEPQPALTRLLDLRGFGWAPVAADRDGVTLAATCTVAELDRWGATAHWPAAALIGPCCGALLGSFKVWNAATVGGNICLALPAGPMTALVAALDGTCRIWTASGSERDVPVASLVTGAGRTGLAPGDLLRSIRLPARALRRHTSFRQASLTPNGRSAALLIGTTDRDGSFRLTVTAATVRPVVLTYPVRPGRDRLLGDVAALPDTVVFGDVHGSAPWKRALMVHLAADILAEVGPS